MYVLFVMAVCGVLTFLLRFSFIAGGRWLPGTPWLHEVLRYVPPAVLMALIVPEIFVNNGVVSLGLDNLRLWAAATALLTAWLTRHVLATMAAGMVALWLLQYFAR